MKKTKKFLAFLLAMIMVLAMGMTAMAADVQKTGLVTGPNGGGEASITVTLPTVPEGTTANNTYEIYKVFDATTEGDAISYKLVPWKTAAPAGFSVDNAGNVTYDGGKDITKLTATDIENIAKYVGVPDLAATVTTTVSDKSFTVDGLPYGYYYITTTTGALVTVDSTNPNATVTDKNTVPELDKKITSANSVDEDGKKALAEIGSVVKFTATITVGNGAKGYVFYDKMSDGLTYNGDFKGVLVNNSNMNSQYYTYTDGTSNDSYTFKISFDDEYMKTLEAGTVITIEYSATINENALTSDPEKNTAYLSYGDENSNNRTPYSETEVYNAKFTVTKKDGEGAPLAGAGFVVKNADGKYYKLANKDITWVDSIDQATEYTSDTDGNVPAFTGLANGTYTLVENTVPAGYNKAADYDFTVKEHDYEATNLEQTTDVINNAGAELPSTGGVGTTMFYVVGGALVLAAVVLLVTRKRMSVEK